MSVVLDVSADGWEKEILKSDTLVLVDFWHKHCPWCIRLEPVFSEVADDYVDKVKFAKLNVLQTPENQKVAVRYGILGTPTLAFFCEGRPIETVTGFKSKEELRQLVEDMIEKHRECLKKTTKFQTS